jgi:hypothetical protein
MMLQEAHPWPIPPEEAPIWGEGPLCAVPASHLLPPQTLVLAPQSHSKKTLKVARLPFLFTKLQIWKQAHLERSVTGIALSIKSRRGKWGYKAGKRRDGSGGAPRAAGGARSLLSPPRKLCRRSGPCLWRGVWVWLARGEGRGSDDLWSPQVKGSLINGS